MAAPDSVQMGAENDAASADDVCRDLAAVEIVKPAAGAGVAREMTAEWDHPSTRRGRR